MTLPDLERSVVDEGVVRIDVWCTAGNWGECMMLVSLSIRFFVDAPSVGIWIGSSARAPWTSSSVFLNIFVHLTVVWIEEADVLSSLEEECYVGWLIYLVLQLELKDWDLVEVLLIWLWITIIIWSWSIFYRYQTRHHIYSEIEEISYQCLCL